MFHVSQLKLYKKPEDTMRTYKKPDPVITAAREEEFEIEEIINHQKRRCGKTTKMEYLILWKGYPAHEMTWELEKNVKNAQEKITEYYRHVEGNVSLKEGRRGECRVLDSCIGISFSIGLHLMPIWDSRIVR